MNNNQNNSSGCWTLIVIIIVIAFLVYALRGFQNPSNEYSQSVGGFIGIGVEYPSKIMEYTGSKLMKVCERPYYGDSECYLLQVSSNGESFTRINFPNGGYILIYDVECSELASFYNNSGDNRFFCNTYDIEDNIWDIFLPTTNID